MKKLPLCLHGLSLNVWEVGKENIDGVRSESPRGTWWAAVAGWLTVTLVFLNADPSAPTPKLLNQNPSGEARAAALQHLSLGRLLGNLTETLL